MRSPKLTSAILAVAAVLALATAGAAAARIHPNHVGRRNTSAGSCHVSLNVAPRLITSGEAALAFGHTKCPEGDTVTLYERAAGATGYSVAGTTTTDKFGSYQVATPALENNSSFYAVIGSSHSERRNVKVAATVTLAGPPESIALSTGLLTGRRNAVTFEGTVSPDDAGAEVVLQRENALRGNEWHRIGHTIVTSTGPTTPGKFAITHVFVVPGPSDLRVVVHSNHRNVASPSNVLSYTISQAQNPSLTINSSADPIPAGGSEVITGTVAGAPNTTVTLLGRPTHGQNKVITTAMTNGAGEYSFPAQTPAFSTFYHVTGSGRSSALLYEGVKYILTAAPMAESVQSGDPVTFTGTVSPAVVGHAIYLERENLNNTNFHVSQVGTVGAGGVYSISHIFYVPGTVVLRVKIPGDSEYGGTASPATAITITPATTAAKIAPEPLGNTSPTPEGQL